MSTYIQLVNRAIIESGTDLDEILSADFASPTDSMQKKFKSWTTQAWREIQQELNDWQFKSKQAQIIVRPRLLVVDGDRSVAPPVGSTFEGDDTDATFEIVESLTPLDGAWNVGTATAILEYTDLDGNFKWGEYFDELTPTSANTNVFRLKWWGRYNLATEVAALLGPSSSNLLEPNTSTFFIQSTGGSITQDNTASTDNKPLPYMPWADFLVSCEGDGVSRGRPRVITTTPDGQYDFWPRPDEEYLLTFTYSAEPQELAAEDDTPEDLPANYHDMIVWRTVMYYADFQERPAQFARAERRYETYKNRVDTNQRPAWSFAPDAYTTGIYEY